MTACSSCGAVVEGRFCGACGAAQSCGACGVALGARVRFCGQCGAAVAGGAVPVRSRRAVVLMVLAAAVAAAAAAVYLVRRDPSARVPSVAAAAPAGLVERSRFDTLYNRAIRASEEGDLAMLTESGPQALAAYQTLSAPDIDARYHAAMLRLATGDLSAALALADTMTTLEPSHLFPILVREAVARRQGNSSTAAAELSRFLRQYEAEMGAGRVEYVHHRFVLEQALAEARRGGEGGGQ